MVKKPVTLYVSSETYDALRRLIRPKPISREVEELMRARLAELKGEDGVEAEPVDYEALKDEYYRLARYMNQLRKTLTGYRFFEKLVEAARSHGIDEKTFGNVPEVSARLLKEWEGPREPLHLFISFMEAAQEKKRIERQLEEIRLGRT